MHKTHDTEERSDGMSSLHGELSASTMVLVVNNECWNALFYRAFCFVLQFALQVCLKKRVLKRCRWHSDMALMPTRWHLDGTADGTGCRAFTR